MRIAVVHSFYTELQPSGENNVVRDQVAALRAAGHDVELVARYTDDHAQERFYAGRSAITTLTGRGHSPSEQLHRFKPSVVHLHNTFPNWGTRWLRAWAGSTVATLHNYRPICANGLLFRDGHPCEECLSLSVIPAVTHRCYRSSAAASAPLGIASAPLGALRRVPLLARRVVCLNQQAASTFERVLGRPVDVVPNFVPRVRSSTPSRPVGWVYVGRLSKEKGVEELVRMWPPGERLDLIGEGPLAAGIQATARQRPEIHVVGGVLRDVLRRKLGSYEGLILPSVCAEQLPTVVLEALAAGTPSLLSHHVNAARRLKSAGAAEIFAPTGEASFPELLSKVRASRSRMNTAALELYKTEYAPEVWLSRIQPIYDEIAKPR